MYAWLPCNTGTYLRYSDCMCHSFSIKSYPVLHLKLAMSPVLSWWSPCLPCIALCTSVIEPGRTDYSCVFLQVPSTILMILVTVWHSITPHEVTSTYLQTWPFLVLELWPSGRLGSLQVVVCISKYGDLMEWATAVWMSCYMLKVLVKFPQTCLC